MSKMVSNFFFWVAIIAVAFFYIAWHQNHSSPSGTNGTTIAGGYRSVDGIAVAADDPLIDKPKQYLFGQISWGSSKSEVVKQMLKQGFALTGKDRDGDLIFTGKIADEDTTAFVSLTPENKLVRVQLVLSPPEERFWQKYEIILNKVKAKYGEPYKYVKKFDAPYKENDGYEAQAIKNGKATYNAEWWTTYTKDSTEEGSSSAIPGLTIFMRDKLLIYMTYISKNWSKEYDRRYNKGTNGL